MMPINPVFFRELLLLRKKTLRLGYIFSSFFMPLIYLCAFGWGLGSRVQLEGTSYAGFLVPGLLAMTAMNNSFNLSASSISMGRLFSRSAQTIFISPIGPWRIVNGYLLAGMVRGLLGCGIVVVAALLLFGGNILSLSWYSLAALTLDMAFFSLLGVIVGISVSDMENVAVITNFVIMPMAFFSGTFFPLQGLPPLFSGIAHLLPLSQVNLLMRAKETTPTILLTATVLVGLCLAAYAVAVMLLYRYQE
jgi:ABC-type multidrug transport system permease subunit